MRPKLNLQIEPEDFMDYYWLKEELVDFCRRYNLPARGNKNQLTQRIHEYLKSGIMLTHASPGQGKNPAEQSLLSLDALIPEGYRNDERHRAFFASHIGPHFRFNVPFMNWMKEHTGHTYKEAVAEWIRIYQEKKSNRKSGIRTEISPQFEYNRYIRDFFEDNPMAGRDDAILCWKYKKSLPGPNSYERDDLMVFD